MNHDDEYFEFIVQALQVCREYRPKFGQGRKAGLTLDEFRTLYGADPFYSWFGLDTPRLYAAHKAAGGMTSLYRQIGMACERVFRQVVIDTLGLTREQADWSYSVPGSTRGKQRRLTLDARIPLNSIPEQESTAKVHEWICEAASLLKVRPKVLKALDGAVFEVRQGYKSKDAKRQNADIANAANAYANAYLPVVVVLSTQIDDDIAERYSRAQWLVLRGSCDGSSLESTYTFTREILGYDLAGFFERSSPRICEEVDAIVEVLLT